LVRALSAGIADAVARIVEKPRVPALKNGRKTRATASSRIFAGDAFFLLSIDLVWEVQPVEFAAEVHEEGERRPVDTPDASSTASNQRNPYLTGSPPSRQMRRCRHSRSRGGLSHGKQYTPICSGRASRSKNLSCGVTDSVQAALCLRSNLLRGDESAEFVAWSKSKALPSIPEDRAPAKPSG